MARQKSPKETKQQIISVSLRLFMENGYEHTSIQDIIDNLGDLSRGAIYHHFKSKEQILIACTDQLYGTHDIEASSICADTGLTAAQKLRKLFNFSIANPSQKQAFSAAPNLLKTPQMLAILIRSSIEESIPNYILPLIKQGIADGSIKTDYPQELAEITLLLANLWLNPMVIPATPEEIIRKIHFFAKLLCSMGLDIIDEEALSVMADYTQLISQKK